MSAATLAEARARHDGDLVLFQQPDGEFLLGEPGRADIRERVERAARHVAGEAGGVEASDYQVAAAMVLLAHPQHLGPAVAQRLERGVLGDDRRAQHGVLVHLHHGVDQRCRTAGIADAPAGHREGLRKAVEEDRPLRHARQARDARMRALEGELRVNLIGQHEQVLLAAERGDFLQLLPRARAAGRIARQVEHQDLGARLPGGPQRLGRERKAVLGIGWHRDPLPVRQRDAGKIAHVARLVIHDLVTRIDERPAGEIERLADADRHDDLVGRPVADVEMLLDVA